MRAPSTSSIPARALTQSRANVHTQRYFNNLRAHDNGRDHHQATRGDWHACQEEWAQRSRSAE
eukprot:1669125-Alexandrium_andersonii.AAC.1